MSANAKPVTGMSITLGQIRELFETSTDADVVRAAIRTVGDSPSGLSFLLRGGISDRDATKAHEALAAAWNARTAPRPGPVTAAALDPALCRKLVAECSEDDQRMTRAPWSKVGSDAQIMGDLLVVGRTSGEGDDADDQQHANGDAIARARNNLPAISAQLTAAAEMAERTAEIRRRVTRLSLAAGLPREVWSELCHLDSALSALLTGGQKP